MQGKKFDGGKNRLELIPPKCIEAIGWVLTYGSYVYSANNWQQVEEYRYIGAKMRHDLARRSGEVYAHDTGLLHSAHEATNTIFLLWKDIQKHGLNVNPEDLFNRAMEVKSNREGKEIK